MKGGSLAGAALFFVAQAWGSLFSPCLAKVPQFEHRELAEM